MPYIAAEDRPEIDRAVRALAEVLARQARRDGEEDPTALAGMLNYAITRLLLTLYPEPRYWRIALVTGVLENVKQEFYRRYAAPYEDRKAAENGDVYP